MQKLKLFGSFVLLLISTICWAAEPYTIKGRIIDTNKEPLIAASISVKGTTKGATTNEKGEFTLPISKVGKYKLVAFYLGYQSQEVDVTVNSATTTVEIILKEDAISLDEVMIEGKSPVQQLRETAFNVTAVDAGKLHNTSTDLNQVLNRTTGVRVRESGGMGSDFSFSLNGFSGNQVKFFLDGVPIDNYGSSFTLNNIPVNMAERIEIYKGVVPINLGSDALGGAVNIVTKQNLSRYVDASYSIGSFNTHKASVTSRFSFKNGFLFNINAFGNYSDNSFKVDVEAIDKTGTGKFLPSKKYKRFHDGYKSGTVQAEVGVKNKPFADYLLFGMIVTGNNDQIQQGSNMNRVVGKAYRDSKGFIPSMKYKKSNLFVAGLDFDFSGSFNKTTSHSVDTCSRVYNWDGSYGYRGSQDPNQGELGNKTYYIYKEKTWTTTTNLRYTVDHHNSLGFNHTYTDYNRSEEDTYKPLERVGEPTIKKHNLGLNYMYKALDDRLNMSVFGKMYSMYSKMAQEKKDPLSTKMTNWGYGAAFAYQIIPQLQAKVSYEHAYRLPSPIEMLGDGIYVKSNINLKPESSHNLNLGLAYNQNITTKHFLGLEANFIYRDAKDFIKNKLDGVTTKYVNETNVHVVGLDGTLRYAYSNWLQFEGNMTWQKTTNANKYLPGTDIKNTLYGDQMPNTPTLFTNADISLMKHKLFSKQDKLTFTLGYNYVSFFYLEWPSLGDKRTKKTIPEQFTQNASLTYSLANNKYNISVECINLTDKKVYDYYKVQRPGRSFTLKFRYLFNQ